MSGLKISEVVAETEELLDEMWLAVARLDEILDQLPADFEKPSREHWHSAMLAALTGPSDKMQYCFEDFIQDLKLKEATIKDED